MKKVVILFAFIFILFSSFLYGSVDKQTLALQKLAQWNINYASYLIDVGKYLDALDAYNTAYEVTPFKKTKLQVLLYKANLLATFLDAEEEALKIYNFIISQYPDGKEIALYKKGLLLFDMEKYKEAASVLSTYLKEFPGGKFRFQAEVLFEKAKTAVAPSVPYGLKVLKSPPMVRVLLNRKTRKVILEGNTLLVNGTSSLLKRLVVTYKDILSGKYVIKSSSPIKVIAGKYSKRVRGDIILKPKKGRIYVLNVLDIETYLWGVVPAESYPSWPLETLKAQAVASRTYAYYQVLHRKNWAYDLVDNEGDQAYKGVDRETPLTTKAVNETRGEVLIEGNRPILAMFTANSGGYTADASFVFKLNKNYLVAKPDPLSLKGKMANWKRSFSASDIENRLRKIGLPIKGLRDIIPVMKGPSGRIIKVKIVADNFSKVYRARSTVSRALRLPEILFSIEKVGDKYVFKGHGWGHGVGYSQWGSAEMGKRGYFYKKILNFYYSPAKLVKLWR